MEIWSLIELKTFHANVSERKFWDSIDVWICKPASINRNIAGVNVLTMGCFSLFHDLNKHKFESMLALSRVNSSLSKEKLISLLKTSLEEFDSSVKDECEFFLRFLYPKTGDYSMSNVDFIIKDYKKNKVVFIKPVSEKDISSLTPKITYGFSLEGKTLKLLVDEKVSHEKCSDWLCDILFPKLCTWLKSDLQTKILSHTLVPAEKYLSKYCELKAKYSKVIMEIWSECTDPQKFIYEDLAIASYLIVLWGGESQRFVDLGCGNGLLVYILTEESHQGLGLDVRSRKIWDKYPSNVVLQECTIHPSIDYVLPATDWVIGNHSDELTPWIPVLTALSSYETNFFLLPCCPYEFNGRKYARINTSKSTYLDYIDYIEQLCQMCGFKIQKDRLKIPSTKRICLVSNGRNYLESEKLTHFTKIRNLINSKMTNKEDIVLRERKEKVRNCTQIGKELIEILVSEIAHFLLSQIDPNSETWREGELVDIKDLIDIIPKEQLKLLKKEFGGLQTLLRNHQHIFLVQNGKVKLRKPICKNPPPKIWKQKSCWFFLNHPDSCPLKDDECSYKHANTAES